MKNLSIFFKSYDNTFANQGTSDATPYMQNFMPYIFSKDTDIVAVQNTFFMSSTSSVPQLSGAVGNLYGYIEPTKGVSPNQLCQYGFMPGWSSNTVTYDSTNSITGIHKFSIPLMGNTFLSGFRWFQSPSEAPGTNGDVRSGVYASTVNGNLALCQYGQYGTMNSSVNQNNFNIALDNFETYCGDNPGLMLCYLNLNTAEVFNAMSTHRGLNLYPNGKGIPSSISTVFMPVAGTVLTLLSEGYFIITKGIDVRVSLVPLMTPLITETASEPLALSIELLNYKVKSGVENTLFSATLNNIGSLPGTTVNA